MTADHRLFGRWGFLAVVCVLAAPRAAAGIEANDPDWRLCAEAIPEQEQVQEIPSRLLRAISLAESRRWDEDLTRNEAWPWTVMAQGRGRFFETKEQAINEVLRRFSSRQICNTFRR